MKVILVGLGRYSHNWIETIQRSKKVKLAGCVDPDPERVNIQAGKYKLKPDLFFPSLAEALANVKADGIINLTPPAVHRAVSVEALQAGVPVLSEKPLADNMEAAQAIVDTANQTGVLHMVSQNYRYKRPFLTVKHLLDSGTFGAITSIVVRFAKGTYFPGFHDTLAYPLVLDMSIHHFDLMRFLLDRDPLSVIGHSWNLPWGLFKGDANTALLFRFPEDVVVSYTGTWSATGQETPWNGNWQIDCQNGVIVLQDDQVYMQHRTGEEENDYGFTQYLFDALTPVKPVKSKRVEQDYLLHEFYTAVTKGIPPATTCQDNIKSLKMVFDAIRSFETGTMIT
jgi:predicted dehydrogenase